VTLVSGNVRFMWIFAGVPWRGGIERQISTYMMLYVCGLRVPVSVSQSGIRTSWVINFYTRVLEIKLGVTLYAVKHFGRTQGFLIKYRVSFGEK